MLDALRASGTRGSSSVPSSASLRCPVPVRRPHVRLSSHRRRSSPTAKRRDRTPLFAVEADVRWARDGIRAKKRSCPEGFATNLQRHVTTERFAQARPTGRASAELRRCPRRRTSSLPRRLPMLQRESRAAISRTATEAQARSPSRRDSDGRPGVAPYPSDSRQSQTDSWGPLSGTARLAERLEAA